MIVANLKRRAASLQLYSTSGMPYASGSEKSSANLDKNLEFATMKPYDSGVLAKRTFAI